MALQAFYSNPDLTDGFGATAGRRRPHRGLDFAKPVGTPVPALAAGRIVLSQWEDELGWVIEVEYDSWGKWRFNGHCHLRQQGLRVGARVKRGDTLGNTGNTGNNTLGPHDHVTLGDRVGAVLGASMAHLTDPWPRIKTALTPPTPSNPAEPEEEDDLMYPLYVQDAATKNQGTIYRVLSTGKKRAIPTAEWNAIRAQQTSGVKAGVSVPVLVAQISAADLKAIPNV